MSFAEELLDGFDVLQKRTSTSADEVKALIEFYKSIG